ncbi:MAG: peptide/nickel transport system permease protein [Cellvibrionaceae bacterium]|jgi:peptide/nickel transport system permease protein
MLKLILARIAWAIATLFFVSIIIFVAIEMLPGDMATSFLGRDATPESLAFYREEFGVNRPLFVRYTEWFLGVLRGDFGTSPLRNEPITELIKYRIRNTVVLGLSAALIGIPLAIFLGILTALTRDKYPDIFFSTLALGLMTLPEFVLATFLIFFLAIQFRWFPAVALVSIDAPIREIIPNITLPIITLTCVMVAHILRLVRTSLIDVMESDFVVMAQLKGAPRWRVVLYHALPNAMLPTINIIALTVAWLLGGSVIIESMFNYPGIGSAMLVGITARDFMMVQAIAMALAIVYISLNLTADILTLLLNPRLRTERAS